jgi:alpha-tubulin suppressor-like RCC1 family protein
MTAAASRMTMPHCSCLWRRRRITLYVSHQLSWYRRQAWLAHGLGCMSWLLVAVLALAACGGGDDAAAPASALIGPAGGTINGSDGAKIVVPAGALATPTTLAIEQTTAGAPALPSGFVAAGKMFAFTPHGTTFTAPVTITIPIDPSGVPAGQSGSFYKTDGAGGWQRVAAATVAGNFVSAEVTSFSNGQFGSAPPVITQQPRNAAVAVGDTATFSVVAINAPPFTYQWEDSIDGGANWRLIVGAAGSTFTTAPATLADDRKRFRVVVSNPDGPTTSNAAVLSVNTVVVPAAITTQPANVSTAVGGAATFSVAATGSNLQYRWRRSDDGGVNFADINGANNASYTFANAQLVDNNAQFLVVVSNTAGPVTSGVATLSVTAAPPPLVLKSRLAAQDGFSLALGATGVPYSWGSDSATALGNGPTESNRLLAAPLGTLTNVSSVVAGDLHGIAVRSDGTVWAFGYTGSIVCGAGGVYDAPVQIAGAVGIAAASTGASHTLLLTGTGTVMSFGCNSSNQLGRPATMQPDLGMAAPVVGFPAGTTIIAVAAGRTVSLALDSNHNIWSWGQGPLGDGSNLPSGRATPTQVPNLAGVEQIAAGADHVLARLSDGSVWAWGSNTNGKLGNGTTTDAARPTATGLGAGSGVTAIAAGAEASLAVRGGMVLSWGSNAYGGLGAGPGAPFTRPDPAPVVGLSNVLEVAMGSGLQHGLARLVDGTVWAWGDNRSGQLGNGTTSTQPVTTPVQVTGLNLN